MIFVALCSAKIGPTYNDSEILRGSLVQISLLPTFGWADFRAKTSRWREWAHEQGFVGRNLDCFTTLLSSLESIAPAFLSSRTFQACSLVTRGEISKSLFERWPTSGILSDGVLLTARTSESPNLVRESTLSELIETGRVHSKYFLSRNAAKGMLRRANRMGRPLFPPLRTSLEILSTDPSTNE